MAGYYTILASLDVADAHSHFLRTIALAERNDQLLRSRGLPPVNGAAIAQLQSAYRDFQRGLRDVSLSISALASQEIVTNIRKTAVRDDTGVSPHLRDRIISRALPPVGSFQTGAVGVADEDFLNSGTTGLYWRAQEYGTGSGEVGSITTAATGRLLRGYFYATGFRGYPSPPADDEFQHHAVFKAGPPLTGPSKGLPFGIGTVRREIQPRHFIRDGSIEAARIWAQRVQALQIQTLGRIAPVAPRVAVP